MHSLNVRRSLKFRKKILELPILDFKAVNSACYDTQQVCVYLQPFSC